MIAQGGTVIAASGSSDGPIFALMLIAVLGSAVWLLTPLVRALARRLEGRSAAGHVAGEVEELRARVQELETQQGRMHELEERLDFAERLLMQQREAERPRIGPGGLES